MNINGNFPNKPIFGNMPGFGNMQQWSHQPHYPKDFVPLPRILPDCPKGGIIPNYHAPKGMDTINYFGKTGPDVINYHGAYQPKIYHMQSYNCPPAAYHMVDVNWCAPHVPQPIYYPKGGCATC